ncbi:MAG: ABC transporter ATP-binding protein [Bacteroidales bacterium]|nr:ABC transporter ATP-binding protein [Bacteroidales bacterium]
MKPIGRIFAYLRHFPLQIAMNVLFNVLHIVFNLGSYVMIVPFVELLFGSGDAGGAEPALAFSQQAVADWAFWHLRSLRQSFGLWRCLLAVGAGYLACSLLSNLFRYIAMAFLSSIRNGMIERLRNDVYHRVTVLPIGYFTRQRRGDLISRMSNDLFDVEWSVVSTLQYLVKDPVNIVFFAATLIFVSWRLFVIFLLVLPLGVLLIARIGKRLKRDSGQGQDQLGGLFAAIEEALGGVKAIKAAGREDGMSDRFASANGDYARTMVRVARRKELSSPLSEVLGTLALVVILIVGGWQVTGGYIMPSVFIFFVIVFARLIPPIQAVVKAYNSLLKGAAAARRFFDLLDADEQIEEQPSAVALAPLADAIELKDVSFAFEDGVTVLDGINLTIRRGQTVALVGPSGAGKSTLVDLLPRLREVTGGQVVFDGVPIREAAIDSLRSQFGIVSQDCFLFNDTVAANIAFGAAGYTDRQIRAAAVRAGADGFISQLPQGYDTVVGDRGFNLSGGQRQRIAIARAMLRDTPVMILDEATSALDSASERDVMEGLAELLRGRTAVVIAHRLSTVRNADLIVVLDGGRIVQQGTHDELVAQPGMYRKLVDMQGFGK